MAVASVVLLLTLAAPALAMKLRPASIETLPADIAQVQTFKRMEQSFPQQRPSLQIVVAADADEADAVARALTGLAQQVTRDPDFAIANAASVWTSADATVSMIDLGLSHDEGDQANTRALERMRSDLAPAAVRDVVSAQAFVGGGLAEDYDSSAHLRDRLPWVIAFVLGLTMLMMLAMLRSPVIAVLTTLLNLLSVGAAFGVMTLVFQYHWAEGLLDFRSSGFLIDWVPLFCFVVLVGLSMDYHVFVLSRVREGLQAGLPYRQAVADGIRSTASVVTSAAAVMVSVFAVFAALSMTEMKMMGVGLATAVLIDATVVRLVLLPACLLLFERRLGGLRRGIPPAGAPASERELARV
jgi:putative drug exporter of the RND superfamily